MKSKKLNDVSSIGSCKYLNSQEFLDKTYKANNDWIKFKHKHKIPDKYLTNDNKDMFMYMDMYGMDAEQAFLSKIKEIEKYEKRRIYS